MSLVRKVGLFFAAIVLLLLILILALPLWIPLVISLIANKFGIGYDGYERIGYGRFALNEVVYSVDETEIQAERIETLIPTAWGWKLMFPGEDQPQFLVVENWRVEVDEKADETPKPESEEREISVYEIVETVESVLPLVADWFPRATLSKGEVVLPERAFEVPVLSWNRGMVAGEIADSELGETVFLEADLTDNLPYSVSARTERFPLEIELSVDRADGGVRFWANTDFAGNEILSEAFFAREGLLPESARIELEQFSAPPEYVEIEGYREVVGSLFAEWEHEEFDVRLHLEAEPESGEERFPPLRADAEVHGNLQRVAVTLLDLDSPWMTASLSEPLSINYDGTLLSDESVFAVGADLSKQPFAELKGALQGSLSVRPGEGQFPEVDFDLHVNGFSGYGISLDRIRSQGGLKWPIVNVSELSLLSADRLETGGSLEADLEAKEFLAVAIDGEVRADFVRQWLPEELDFESVRFRLGAEGEFENLAHTGRVEFSQVILPQVRVFDGEFGWEGQMEDLARFAAELRTGEGRLILAGGSEVDLKNRQGELTLSEVRLERLEEVVLESLVQSRIQAEWPEEIPIRVGVDQLHWRGPESEIELAADVSWPVRGNVAANLRGLSTKLISDFVDVEMDAVTVPSLAISGGWDEGPIDFEAGGEVRLLLDEAGEIFVEIDVAAGEEELRIERLRAIGQGEVLALAEGALPVSIWPGQDPLIEIRENAPVSFRAEASPHANLWREIERLSGVHLFEPHMVLELSGTPAAPIGSVRGHSPEVRITAAETAGQPIPAITDFRFSAGFDEARIALEELALRVEDQEITAEASLRMDSSSWEGLFRGELPEWTDASARIEIPDARLAPFTQFAPELLSPEGRLTADVALVPGGMLEGSVVLEDAATRPLVPFGSLRSGTARLVFKGRSVEVEEISAIIGGERLMITGGIDLPIEQPFGFGLNIRGTNLPLARQPGVVIRGDLDLNVRRAGEDVPVISGAVDLHNSYYFAHIRLMPSGAVATPARRPPFFSVEAEPFNLWRLDVQLRGPEFLEVRGPVFQGLISADFHLTGTLEEPQALGAALIESGRVRFPFASLSIEQGEIALRPENPYQPQLFIIAGGMAFDYDLQMEVSGTAEEPIIEFSANPPLTSEQALLMITTGELPRDEIRFTTQQRATKFAIYFGQNLLYEITGDDSASDRLLIRSGEQISEGGRETMVIEFRLTDRWSVLGEYDRFDEYNVGLKWRFYSR